MADFTSGPWLVMADNALVCSYADAHDPVIIADCVTSQEMPQPERTANANLIAAAPDLLEALAMARLVVIAHDTANEIRGFGPVTVEIDGRPVRDVIEAALAKAEGR